MKYLGKLYTSYCLKSMIMCFWKFFDYNLACIFSFSLFPPFFEHCVCSTSIESIILPISKPSGILNTYLYYYLYARVNQYYYMRKFLFSNIMMYYLDSRLCLCTYLKCFFLLSGTNNRNFDRYMQE